MKRLLLIPLVLFLACEKEDKHGCLDSQACNYDSNATIDNNSCIYEFDCSGDCGALDTSCVGCDGIQNSGFALDSCGVCQGDNTTPHAIFADDHWSLYSWITNTRTLQDLIQNELGADWNSDVQILGTHHLDIVYNDQLFSSDCIYMEEENFYDDDQCLLPGIEGDPPASVYNSWILGLLNMDLENNPDSISVIKDCEFYENIGQYDQFVAGWDGILENFIIQFVEVGDNTETIITSPIKEEYLYLYNSALEGN